MHFGRALRRRREERGLSQEELAGRADSSTVYISALERGLYNPTIGVVFELARALEIQPIDLIKDIPSGARVEGPKGRPARRR